MTAWQDSDRQLASSYYKRPLVTGSSLSRGDGMSSVGVPSSRLASVGNVQAHTLLGLDPKQFALHTKLELEGDSK